MTSQNGGLDRVGVEAVVAGISQYVQDAGKFDRANQGMDKSQHGLAQGFKESAVEAVKFGIAITGVQLGAEAALEVIREVVGGTIEAAITFESSFTKVRQVTDLTEEGFAQLSAQNRALAKTWPVNIESVNELVARGSELGVKGVADLNKFATTMIKTGLATGATALEAADGLENLRRTFGGSEDDVAKYASVLDELEQKFGANATKILAFQQDLSGVGKTAGFTADQILAISAAAISVGADSSFAFTSLITTIQKATVEGGDNLATIASTSGKSSAAFIQQWKTDAAGAFSGFIEGIGKSGPAGLRVLDQLGLGQGRVAQGVLALAAQEGRLPAILAAANAELKNNVALNAGAALEAGTAANQIKLLENKIHDMQITAGEAAVKGFAPLITKVNEWLDAHGEQAASKIADAISAMIPYAEALAKDIGAIVDAVKNLAAIPGVSLAISIAMSNADKLTLALLAGVLATAVGGPLAGIVVGAGVFAALGISDLMTRSSAIDARAKDAGIAPEEAKFAEKEFGQTLSSGDLQRIRERAQKSGSTFGAAASLASSDPNFHPSGPIATPSIPVPTVTGGVTKAGGAPNIIFAPDKSAEDAEKKRLAELQKFLDDAAAAKKKANQDDITRLDQLGTQITDALKTQYDHEFEIVKDGLDAKGNAEDAADKATLKRIQTTRDVAIKAAEDERDRTIKAIEATRDARVAGLNAQIDALQATDDAQKRADLVRQLGLAYDSGSRSDIQKQLDSFDRQQQVADLRNQIQAVQDAAQNDIAAAKATADTKTQLARDSADAQTTAEQARHDAAVASLADELKQAQKFHDAITSDAFLQSKARYMIMSGEVDAITKLLGQDDRWRTAGYSMGESIKNGLRASLAGTVAEGLAGVPGSAQNVQRTSDVAALLAFEQNTGASLKAGGAPASILEGIRKQITDAGAVPAFATGLEQGQTSRTMMALLHPDEVVINKSQAAMIAANAQAGTTFGAEAFARMFDGAYFTGTPEENMEAARRMWGEMMEEQIGRDAWIAGAGR